MLRSKAICSKWLLLKGAPGSSSSLYSSLMPPSEASRFELARHPSNFCNIYTIANQQISSPTITGHPQSLLWELNHACCLHILQNKTWNDKD
jgi:hypothetical protein